jgi:hypothetical protein
VDPLVADTLVDARWFAHRYDVSRDEFHFVWIPPNQQRALTFLAEIQAPPEFRRRIPRSALPLSAPSQAPLHLIVHSGLGGSTLLARALSKPGAAIALKEPPILTDVVAHRLKGAPPDDNAALLRQVASLMARPFAPGEAVIVKLSSVGNGLAQEIAAARADTQILCLQTPLEQMLASLTARGPEGRLGGRKLFTGLRNSRMVPFASADETERLSDLQLAALAWLAIQRMFDGAAKAFGPSRVRGIDSTRMLGDFEAALGAIAAHFGIAIDPAQRLASGIANRHAKTGEPFSSAMRARRFQAMLRDHGKEIATVADWTRKTAEAEAIPLEAHFPLLDF